MKLISQILTFMFIFAFLVAQLKTGLPENAQHEITTVV